MPGEVVVAVTGPKAAKIAGVPYSTVDYWARSGFLVPSVAAADGSGSRRLYNFGDLVALRVAKVLRSRGVSLQKLRRVVNYLRKHQESVIQPLTGTVLLTDGRSVYILDQDTAITDIVRGGQLVFALALDKLVDSVKHRTMKINPFPVAVEVEMEQATSPKRKVV